MRISIRSKLFPIVLAGIVCLLAAQVSLAQRRPSYASYQSNTGWNRIGLELAWKMQVDAGRGRFDEVKTFFHVSNTKKSLSFEVVYDGGNQLFAPDHLDRFGHPLGETEAARLADLEVRILKTRGIDARVETREIRNVTIYVQSGRSMLNAIDGESGELLWNLPTGRPDYPSFSPTANEDFAAVVNGSTLYVVRLEDGKLMFERRLESAPGAGPAMTSHLIFVPLLSGLVEAYRLNESEWRRPPIRFSSFGGTHVKPTVTPGSVSWPTDRGLLYVADSEKGRVRFRMEARSELVSHSTYLHPNRLVAASVDGYVFCVAEDSGRMLWQFSAGQSLMSAPIAVDEQVLVVSESDDLFAVDGKRGTQSWIAKGITQVVSVGTDRLYCVGSRSDLVALDRESGRRLDSLPVSGNENFITNPVSDRIYLISASGQLMCLRQKSAIWPTIHVTPFTEEDEGEESDHRHEPGSHEPGMESAGEASAEVDNPFEHTAVEEAEMFDADGDNAEEDDMFGGEDEGDDLFGDEEEDLFEAGDPSS